MIEHRWQNNGGRITAVLGPTNTGKTHLAVERMLGHRTGIIGLPLRLLAREIYDRVVVAKGLGSVGLITGEEKIIPARPNYFVCTVEAMPLDWHPDFLAVDEIQLCSDSERGHVFTDRLLNARGEQETMFLGAKTMKAIIGRLLPEVKFIERPRFSILSYSGEKKLSRLPRRSAIVAFSSSDVYSLAELIRRQHGGAAVIMGSLSPRTRNAQVALYQSGEVDYMIATDAIGMGLNLDVDHVAFAAKQKFDGVAYRSLYPTEVGQIAGRAGRHMNDGTFGTTGSAGPMDRELISLVENHHFPDQCRLRWRNRDLDFHSPATLIHSLRRSPGRDDLSLVLEADDTNALNALLGDSAILEIVGSPVMMRLLWDVCGIPDFAKTMPEVHHRTLKRVFRFLASDDGRIPPDWIDHHMRLLDRVDGDIDTLAGRIAHVRTWTYVAHQAQWLDDAKYWQERTRGVEDALSDALHKALTLRFVDRRSAALYRGLSERRELLAAITLNGEVLVEGQFVGLLNGLKYEPDAAADRAEGKALRAAANRVLAAEIIRRAEKLVMARQDTIKWQEDQMLWWEGAPVARVISGSQHLEPRIEMLPIDYLDGVLRERVRNHLQTWVRDQIRTKLSPLLKLLAVTFTGPARGLVYQLVEALGVIPRAQVPEILGALSNLDRGRLNGLGVRLGYQDIFMPALLRPARILVRTRLWKLNNPGLALSPLPISGQVSLMLPRGLPLNDCLSAYGFRPIGQPSADLEAQMAVRVDIFDRLARLAHSAIKNKNGKNKQFVVSAEMLSLLGEGRTGLDEVLIQLGYIGKGNLKNRRYSYFPLKQKKKSNSSNRSREIEAQKLPFSELQNLLRQ